jgi:hypothetical protein
VREFDALGRPGRARGVDQRRDVAGLRGAPSGVEVERRVVLERVKGLDVEHLERRIGGTQALVVLALGDRPPAAGVGEHLCRLLGRERGVDRERGRAEVQRRRVAEREFRPVAHHQGDGLPPLHASRGESGGERPHATGVLAPCNFDPAADRPQRHPVRVRLHRPLERAAQRLGHASLHMLSLAKPEQGAGRVAPASLPGGLIDRGGTFRHPP